VGGSGWRLREAGVSWGVGGSGARVKGWVAGIVEWLVCHSGARSIVGGLAVGIWGSLVARFGLREMLVGVSEGGLIGGSDLVSASFLRSGLGSKE